MTSERDVVRVTNPQGLLQEPILELLRRGLESSRMIEDVGAAMVELAQEIGREELALFLGYEGTEWKGLALAQWSNSAFNRGCVVIHFFNEGTKELRTLLMQRLVEYARAGDFKHLIGLDMNETPQAFARLFSAAGKPVFRGEVFTFDLDEGLL